MACGAMAARFVMAAVRLSPTAADGDGDDQAVRAASDAQAAAAAALAAVAAGLSPAVSSLLHHGGLLTAYIPEADGSNSYFTRVLSLFLHLGGGSSGGGGGACLYWCESGRREMRPSRAIPLVALRAILVGKHTSVMQYAAISADPDRCFSLQWHDECIDLECETEAQRANWLALIDHLLAHSGRRVIEQPTLISVAELDGPIDPLSFLSHRSASVGDATAFASQQAGASAGAVAAAAMANASGPRQAARVSLPSADRFFAHVGSAIDLDFSTRKSKRFLVLDPSPPSDDPTHPAAATLADTLQQFQQWIDATPLQPPAVPADSSGTSGNTPGAASGPARASLLTDARAATGPRSAALSSPKSQPPTPSHHRQGSCAASVAPKDDPRSLEGSLSRLGAGVFFQYCSPPSDVDPTAPALTKLASTVLATAAARREDGSASPPPVSLPGEVPPPLTRPESLSEAMTSIVLFYAPHARRATERSGRNLGQLSWCDSQVWTRKAAWKLPLHVDSVVLLGKRSANMQRACFASLDESSCFSIVNGEGSAFAHSVDLFADGGWPAIRAWLHDVDRILRSGGYALARAGGMAMATPNLASPAFGSPSMGSSNGSLKTLPVLAAPLGLCTRLVFVSQADLAKSAAAQQAERARPPSIALLQLGQGPPLATSTTTGTTGGADGSHRRGSSKAPQLFTFPSVSAAPHSTTHSAFSATSSMASSTTMDASASGGAAAWAAAASSSSSLLAAPSSSAPAKSLHVRAGSRDLQVPHAAAHLESSPRNRSAKSAQNNRQQNGHPLPPIDHLAGQTSPTTPGVAPAVAATLPAPNQPVLPQIGGAKSPRALAIDPHAPAAQHAAIAALSPPHSTSASPTVHTRLPLSSDVGVPTANPSPAHRRAASNGVVLPPLSSPTHAAPQQQQHQAAAAMASQVHSDSESLDVGVAVPLRREASVSRSPHMLSMSTAPRSPSHLPLTHRMQHMQM